MKISPHVIQVQPPPITEVKKWIANQQFTAEKPLLDLCQAIPSYAPPAELIKYLQGCLEDPLTFKYSPDEGLPEVRAEVARWYGRHYQSTPDPDQLCLTIGASQAFWLAIISLCRPGDEVIVQLPAYFDHLMALQSLGIKAVFAPFQPASQGQPELATIARLITAKTKAILLVTPSNPTGAVVPASGIEQLFELAAAHNATLILDETYNAFVGQQPHNLLTRADWSQHFIHLASFGKTFALTGLRCGALLAAAEVVEQALKLQDSMVVCQSRPAQLALQYGCHNLDAWVADNCRMMKARHDSFKKQFLAAGLEFELAASGSFFAWIRHPWKDLTGRQATRRLAEQHNLICLPGEAFGPGLEGYLRLAFGNIDTDRIPQVIKRFQAI